MKKYKCFIIDDEPLAIKVIEQHLAKFNLFEVCGTSTEPLEALTLVKQQQPDLLFIDIQMPDLSGLDLIEAMQSSPDIVITTAYREYAVEGFELNVLDYLVKPIPFKRFVKAIDKFLNQQQVKAKVGEVFDEKEIFVKADRKTIKLVLADILYVEGVKDYVKIVLEKQTILTKVSIGNFLKTLPEDQFIRIHKSFIVAKQKITAYTAHDVEINKLEIPIGRIYKEAFFEAVNA
ncbi:MAG: LytTR family DNA-binding domain-containing protein [Saprospiraceae bacterium]